ncbi:hypothetical protein E2C01_062707 [Portunus trituberculatus]|uniref:Uncharacterized protein n=1 Tax=Portunus trituberculatus TaxID=210409 RepID=A0A5B7HG03_PORTR|nr:hypothetical protein [Portunus trituberculatus]
MKADEETFRYAVLSATRTKRGHVTSTSLQRHYNWTGRCSGDASGQKSKNGKSSSEAEEPRDRRTAYKEGRGAEEGPLGG